MQPDQALELATRLGLEFNKHPEELRSHLKHLRAWYAAVRDGRIGPPKYELEGWDLDFIEHWMGLLRIPPYESMFDVARREDGCPRCGYSTPYVQSYFPGGWLYACLNHSYGCGTRWLVLG